ncbi:MAG: ester cyclase [Anaerolineae bacterium]|nr:ester cyclase [Anaerolineae bacterium]
MPSQSNETLVCAFMERIFDQGDLSAVDEFNAADGIDYQEPPGTDFIAHLKQVVVGMRTAFPDIHFEIHELLVQGDMVERNATMTGTHTGTFSLMPGHSLPPTGRKVSVPHMHFMRILDGKTTDLWHLWNVPMMMQQLGTAATPQPAHHSGNA